MINYEVSSKEGFSEKIGELVWMLEHVRIITLHEIAELKECHFDFIPHPESNSIGALLYHIASIEKVHQLISFENRDFTQSELDLWRIPLELGNEARKEIKGHPLQFYLHKLALVRQETIQRLREKDDAWLFEEYSWPNGTVYNQYYLWFHVMEDEMNHRGQIRSLINLYKSEEKS